MTCTAAVTMAPRLPARQGSPEVSAHSRTTPPAPAASRSGARPRTACSHFPQLTTAPNHPPAFRRQPCAHRICRLRQTKPNKNQHWAAVDGLAAKVREQFEKAQEPKELMILEGSAHAQFLFQTDQGDRLMKKILEFLSESKTEAEKK